LSAFLLFGSASICYSRNQVPVARLEVRHLKGLVAGAKGNGKYRMQVKPRKSGGRGDYEFRDARTGSLVPTETALKSFPLVLSGRDLKRKGVAPGRGNGSRELTLELTDAGRARFQQFTTNNVGAMLSIVVDGKLVSVPVVNAPVTDGKLTIPYGPLATIAGSALTRELQPRELRQASFMASRWPCRTPLPVLPGAARRALLSLARHRAMVRWGQSNASAFRP